MLRWIRLLLVIVTGTAFGAEAGYRLRKRCQSWQELDMVMGFLKGELQYASVPLEDIFMRIAEKSDGAFGRFFGSAAEEMKKQEGSTLEQILKESAQKHLKESALSEKERAYLIRICSLAALQDRMTQVHTLEHYLDMIKQEEAYALELKKQKETMYSWLGFMGGLFLAVLLY